MGSGVPPFAPLTLCANGCTSAASAATIAARYAGVPLKDGSAATQSTQSSTISLETPKGVLKGCGAVMRYIAALSPQSRLGGSGKHEQGLVDQWIEFAALEMSNMLGVSAAAACHRSNVLSALETHLSSRTFMVSNHVTLADIAVVVALEGVDLSGHKAVNRVYRTCMAQALFNAAQPKALEEVHEPDNAVLAKLESLGITHKTYAHAPAMTVEEQAQVIGHLPGAKTKNLFLRDKKAGTFLVCAEHTCPTDTKTIAALLKLPPSTNLRFADSELLWNSLKVKQGSVGPLAVVNDTENIATLVIDKGLLKYDIINSHPLRNDRTTAISAKDLLAYASACGHKPTIVDFAAAAKAKGPIDGPAKAKGKSSAPKAKAKANGAPAPKAGAENKKGKKVTLLAVKATKEDDFAAWYSSLIVLSEMIDYYDISGCYILRPWAYEIWEHLQRWFDDRIKQDLEVQNAYFPLFVSQKALEAEKDHVEGFAPEVAWVTRSGDSDLAEPIAVRPTSETIMYPAFAKWIQSHRDLPLKLNQWSNVVRWEFKDPTPFLRSREFLWQEGHTAHATLEEADEMMFAILDLYRRIYEEMLAVPVIKGIKTEAEKFAGGLKTTTVEAYITGSGRAIQGATSHNLGQNFGKMFEINFEGETGQDKQIPWQTSWGFTTRAIGVGIMCHGDNQGLVLPPRVAPLQAVVVPIVSKSCPIDKLRDYMDKVKATLKKVGVRVKVDDRMNYTPGWKYNHWEQKGVPLRLEVGPRDMEKNSVMAVRRYDGVKESIAESELATVIPAMLDSIQQALFDRAKADRDSHLTHVREWKDFVPALEKGDIVLTPWCNDTEWEEKVKAMSREEALRGDFEEDTCSVSVAAKTLCIPLEQPPLPEGTPCFVSCSCSATSGLIDCVFASLPCQPLPLLTSPQQLIHTPPHPIR
ncbi:unnamed protein product [Chrysoparadoxa australica]